MGSERTSVFDITVENNPFMQRVHDLVDARKDRMQTANVVCLREWSKMAGQEKFGPWGLWTKDLNEAADDFEKWFKAVAVNPAPTEIIKEVFGEWETEWDLWNATECSVKRVVEAFQVLADDTEAWKKCLPQNVERLLRAEATWLKLQECWDQTDKRIPVSIVSRFSLLRDPPMELLILGQVMERKQPPAIGWLDVVQTMQALTPEYLKKFSDQCSSIYGPELRYWRPFRLVALLSKNPMFVLVPVAIPESKRAIQNMWNVVQMYFMSSE